MEEIIIIYFLIGIIRIGILFLHPPHNQPIAVQKRRWGNLLFGVLFWLPQLIFMMLSVGIKMAIRYEIDSIRRVIQYRIFGKRDI